MNKQPSRVFIHNTGDCKCVTFFGMDRGHCIKCGKAYKNCSECYPREEMKQIVKFLTPVVYATTPELSKKGLVIVDLEQLLNAQKVYDDTLNAMNNELVKLKKSKLRAI